VVVPTAWVAEIVGSRRKEYSGPITVSATATIKALAVGNGYSQSSIAVGLYTIH
jgi:hypothetical protein